MPEESDRRSTAATTAHPGTPYAIPTWVPGAGWQVPDGQRPPPGWTPPPGPAADVPRPATADGPAGPGPVEGQAGGPVAGGGPLGSVSVDPTDGPQLLTVVPAPPAPPTPSAVVGLTDTLRSTAGAPHAAPLAGVATVAPGGGTSGVPAPAATAPSIVAPVVLTPFDPGSRVPPAAVPFDGEVARQATVGTAPAPAGPLSPDHTGDPSGRPAPTSLTPSPGGPAPAGGPGHAPGSVAPAAPTPSVGPSPSDLPPPTSAPPAPGPASAQPTPGPTPPAATSTQPAPAPDSPTREAPAQQAPDSPTREAPAQQAPAQESPRQEAPRQEAPSGQTPDDGSKPQSFAHGGEHATPTTMSTAPPGQGPDATAPQPHDQRPAPLTGGLDHDPGQSHTTDAVDHHGHQPNDHHYYWV